eukprot:jgi/Hompol1/6282/HPOL_002620-RA
MTVDSILSVIQAGSGLTFATFLTLHLSGHMLANIRYDYASSALYTFREFYQTPIVEVVVVGGALVVHVAASAARTILRPNKTKKQSAQQSVGAAAAGETKVQQVTRQRNWHRYSGYILTALMCTHIPATRLLPLYLLPDPSVIDLTYASHSAIKYPGLFHAYYWLLGSAALYHGIYGISSAFKILKLPFPGTSAKTWDYATIAMGAVMASTVLALTGWYEPLFIPHAGLWDDLHHKMLALLPLPFLLG